MKDMTRLSGLAVVGAALLLSASSLAIAFGGPGGGWQRGMMGNGGGRQVADPLAAAEQRLQQEKADLAITEEQQEAWDRYAETVRERAQLMQSHRQALGDARPTPQQRMTLRGEGLEQMQRVHQARQDLFAVLSEEQRERLQFGAGRPGCRRF